MCVCVYVCERERERESTVLGANVLTGLTIAENVKGSHFLVS